MKITRRQIRKIIREAYSHLLRESEEFKPRYKGDTPAKQGADKYVSDQRRQQTPQVNMDFQRNDPGTDNESFAQAHYDDFIDSYIRSSAGPDEFMDMWLLKLDDAGVSYDQDDLVELLELAVENGEMEEGEIFLGERGAW